MGEMKWLSAKGDTKLIWDSDNTDEVKNARQTFKDLLKKGFLAFRTLKDGSKGKELKEFDEFAEHIILVPKIAGG